LEIGLSWNVFSHFYSEFSANLDNISDMTSQPDKEFSFSLEEWYKTILERLF
jgi:hypothetical protein